MPGRLGHDRGIGDFWVSALSKRIVAPGAAHDVGARENDRYASESRPNTGERTHFCVRRLALTSVDSYRTNLPGKSSLRWAVALRRVGHMFGLCPCLASSPAALRRPRWGLRRLEGERRPWSLSVRQPPFKRRAPDCVRTICVAEAGAGEPDGGVASTSGCRGSANRTHPVELSSAVPSRAAAVRSALPIGRPSLSPEARAAWVFHSAPRTRRRAA